MNILFLLYVMAHEYIITRTVVCFIITIRTVQYVCCVLRITIVAVCHYNKKTHDFFHDVQINTH